MREHKTQDLGETMRKLLGVTTGVFVENVREEAFFPEPSIRSGDIILRWAGETVPTREVFEQLYRVQEPGRLVRYLVLRDGRRVSGATRMPRSAMPPCVAGDRPLQEHGARYEMGRRAESRRDARRLEGNDCRRRFLGGDSRSAA